MSSTSDSSWDFGFVSASECPLVVWCEDLHISQQFFGFLKFS